MKKIYYLSLFIFVLLPLVTSLQLDYEYKFKKDIDSDLKRSCYSSGAFCSASAACNITIIYPDETIYINNKLMQNQNSFHNITLTNLNQYGEYRADMSCSDSGFYGADTFYFFVNSNGQEPASSGVIIFFSTLFLIIIGCMAYSIIYSIGHIVRLDFDVLDLAFNWGIYFVLFATHMLSKFYLGDPNIDSLMLIFVNVGAYTHVIVPMIAFIMTMIVVPLVKGARGDREDG